MQDRKTTEVCTYVKIKSNQCIRHQYMELHINWSKIWKKYRRMAGIWRKMQEVQRTISHFSKVRTFWLLSVDYIDQDNDTDPPTHLICVRKRDCLALKGKWRIKMKITIRLIQEGIFYKHSWRKVVEAVTGKRKIQFYPGTNWTFLKIQLNNKRKKEQWKLK